MISTVTKEVMLILPELEKLFSTSCFCTRISLSSCDKFVHASIPFCAYMGILHEIQGYSFDAEVSNATTYLLVDS